MSDASPQNLQQALPGLRRIVQRFWPYIRRERGLIVGSLVALLCGVALRLAEPWPLKFIFDRVIRLAASRKPRTSGLAWLDTLEPQNLLLVCIVALVVLTALRALCDYINRIGFAKIGNRVLTRVRNELYQHLQRLSLAFHGSARAGDLTIRVISDVNMLRDAMVTAILPLLANALVLAGMWAVMFWMQWKLTLLAFASLPLLWYWSNRTSRRIREAARKQRQREGAMAATAAESFSAIKIVQALCLEPIFAAIFYGKSQESQKQDVRTARLSARLERTVDVLLAVVTSGVLWYGVKLINDHAMTAGDMIIFLTYLKRAFNPMQDFAKYSSRLAKATAAGERVIDLLRRTPNIVDQPDAVPAPALRGHVRFEQIGFAYEPTQPVLDRIDFEVLPGQHVAIVGPSGVGKSTLSNLLLRLYDPDIGSVMIDGQDIRGFTLASLRSQISIVLQDSILFAASVRENIGFGSKSATPEEIEAAARLANAHEFIMELPQKYDTILGERGVSLSGGQRQRIAIARATLRRSPILILDEPTTGLDEENERALNETLDRLTAHTTTLLITHDLQYAARADLILHMERGRIIESGTHAELMRASGRYAALYQLQTTARPEAAEEKHAVAL
ncbi:MAG TPA: ABC transporter ATP-binding protein [Tepidisphaeraceae bacterium]|jgi:ATP-binding cassette subfamily B protein|nr:ABC transporter ATP-binding protein [Tepidisphaeraceae bacterium]